MLDLNKFKNACFWSYPLTGLHAGAAGASVYISHHILPPCSVPLTPLIGQALLSASVGGAVLVLPYMLLGKTLHGCLSQSHPKTHFCLQAILAIGTFVASVILGAALLQFALNPIVLCMVTGGLTLGLGLTAIAAVASGINQLLDPPLFQSEPTHY